MSDYIIPLKDDPKAQAIYDQLKKDGVPFGKIDRGYEAWNSSGESHIVGKADGKIQPQEVYNYVFSNYDKYRDLFVSTTKLDFPWALPAADKYSLEVKKYTQWLEKTVAGIKKELKKKGIKKNNPKFPRLLATAILERFGIEVGQSQDMLIKAGLKSLAEKLEKEQEESPFVNAVCQAGLPLTAQIEKGCQDDDLFPNFSVYQAFRIAGQKSGFAICKGVDSEDLERTVVPSIVNKKGGLKFPDKKTADCLPLSSRIVVAAWYASAAVQIGNALTVEQGDLIKGALLLAPESTETHFLYGKWLYEGPQKDLDEAYNQLDLALLIEPNNFGAHFEIGKVLMEQGHIDKAMEEFQLVVVSKAPDWQKAEAYGRMALALSGSGKDTEAIEALKKAVDLDPGYIWARISLIQLYLNDKKYAEAIEQLKAAIKNSHDNSDLPYLYILLGKTYWAAGETKNADSALNAALKIDPENDNARLNVAIAYTDTKKYDDAKELLDQIIASSPQGDVLASAYGMRGLVFQESGKDDEALADYKKAMQLDVNHPLPYTNAGHLYLKKGDLKEAATVLLKAIGLYPNNFEAYNTLGVVYLRLKKYKKAMGYLNEATEINSDYPKPYFNRGLIYMKKGEYKDATNAFADAIDRGMDGADIRYHLAQTYYYLGKIKSEILNLREVTKFNPDFPDAYLSLVIALSSKKNFEDAEKALQKLEVLAPNSAMLAMAKAYLAYFKGDLNAAKEAAEKMLKYDDRNFIAHNIIGVVYAEKGQLKKAKASFKKAREINPDFEAAKNNLSLMEKPNLSPSSLQLKPPSFISALEDAEQSLQSSWETLPQLPPIVPPPLKKKKWSPFGGIPIN